MKGAIVCPGCGAEIPLRAHPFPTVDCLIRYPDTSGEMGVVLVRRRNPPPGWAIPGGFVDYGESVEAAVRREMKEETNLELAELEQFHVYSDPDRDPRFHTIGTVFLARGVGELRAGDDAGEAKVVRLEELPPPEEIAFDHHRILSEYAAWRRGSDEDAAELP
jgi:8-oxo-dGTP diphosphatase